MNKAEFEDLRSRIDNDEIYEDELDEDEADAMSFGEYDEYEQAAGETDPDTE